MTRRNVSIGAWLVLIGAAGGVGWAQEPAETETPSEQAEPEPVTPDAAADDSAEPSPSVVEETIPVDQPAPSDIASEPLVLDEVVVTARRKLESLQDIPTAVSALNAQDMEYLQVNDFGDVGKTVPNLVVQRQFGSSSAPFFVLRNIPSGLLAFQVDSGIGLYIDGVYLGRPAGAAFDIADLERLEVMRGPQGTLFGRNSTGGAINVVTAAPSGIFDGKVQSTVGNLGSVRGKVTLNFPEVGGLRARLTAFHTAFDGYVSREGMGNSYDFAPPFGTLSPASQFGLEDTNAAGVAVSYAGIDFLSIDYRFDYTDKRSSQLAEQALLTYPQPALGGLTPQEFTALFGVTGWDRISLDRLDAVPSDTGESDLKVMGHSLTAAYEFSEKLSIKNIAAIRQFEESVGFNDIDGNDLRTQNDNPFSYIASAQVRDQSQWSDELQFLGGGDTFDWIVGLYVFEEIGNDNNPVFIDWQYMSGQTYTPGQDNGSVLAGAGINDYTAGFYGSVENSSYAGFAHGTYRLGHDWDLSGGARWTKDTRKEIVVAKGAVRNQALEAEFSHPVWDASVTYRLAPAANIYGKVSTGFVSGGIYGGTPFEPETLISYEIGSKADLLGRHLRLNAAVFKTQREHFQAAGFDINKGLFIVDGGNVAEMGFEIETTFVPSFLEDLVLVANYGYVQQKWENDMRPVYPDSNLYLSADYRIATFELLGELNVRTDLEWRSDHYPSLCPVASTTDPQRGCLNLEQANYAADEALIMRGSKRLGAQLALARIPLWGSTSGSLSLWGRNLLDEDNLEFARDLGNGLAVGNFERSRSFGVDLGLEFH